MNERSERDFLHLHPPEGGSAGNSSCRVIKKSSGNNSAPLNFLALAKSSTISLSMISTLELNWFMSYMSFKRNTPIENIESTDDTRYFLTQEKSKKMFSV